MEDFLIEKIEEIAFETVIKTDSLWESRVLDSITIVELAVEIESEYGIKIGFDEIIVENFETIERLINFVKSKQ
jgi:acyl carrier protein